MRFSLFVSSCACPFVLSCYVNAIPTFTSDSSHTSLPREAQPSRLVVAVQCEALDQYVEEYLSLVECESDIVLYPSGQCYPPHRTVDSLIKLLNQVVEMRGHRLTLVCTQDDQGQDWKEQLLSINETQCNTLSFTLTRHSQALSNCSDVYSLLPAQTDTPEYPGVPDIPHASPEEIAESLVLLLFVFLFWCIVSFYICIDNAFERRRGDSLSPGRVMTLRDLETLRTRLFVSSSIPEAVGVNESECEIEQAKPEPEMQSLIEQETRCPICLEDYCTGDTLRILNCKHEFHRHCVDRWLLEESRRCPMCQKECKKRAFCWSVKNKIRICH
jgi:hypothetical protein